MCGYMHFSDLLVHLAINSSLSHQHHILRWYRIMRREAANVLENGCCLNPPAKQPCIQSPSAAQPRQITVATSALESEPESCNNLSHSLMQLHSICVCDYTVKLSANWPIIKNSITPVPTRLWIEENKSIVKKLSNWIEYLCEICAKTTLSQVKWWWTRPGHLATVAVTATTPTDDGWSGRSQWIFGRRGLQIYF